MLQRGHSHKLPCKESTGGLRWIIVDPNLSQHTTNAITQLQTTCERECLDMLVTQIMQKRQSMPWYCILPPKLPYAGSVKYLYRLSYSATAHYSTTLLFFRNTCLKEISTYPAPIFCTALTHLRSDAAA